RPVTPADIVSGVVNNQATGMTDQTDDVSATAVISVPQPDFSIIKSLPMNLDGDMSMDLSVGDTLVYTVTVTNTGTANLTNVVIDDPLLTPDQSTCALLLPSSTCLLTGRYVVQVADLDGVFTNMASATTDQVGPKDASTSVNVPSPSMNVSKSAPVLTTDADGSGDISVGDEITYSITLTNDGSANLPGVMISDPLLTPNSLNCGLLAPSQSCTLTGTYTVMDSDLANGEIENVATGSSSTVPPVGDMDTVRTPLPKPALEVTKNTPVLTSDVDGSGDISSGDVLTYRIIMRNVGQATLTNVVVTDPLITPDQMTCASITPGDSCVLIGTYTVMSSDVTAGSILNEAIAESDQTGPDTASLTISLPTPLQSITKSFISNADNDMSGDISAGDVLTYKIVVTNDGNATLTDVVVMDDDLTPNIEMCSLVPPGDSCVLTGTYTITSQDVTNGSFTNTATAASDQTSQIMDSEMIGINMPAQSLSKSIISNSDTDASMDVSVGDTLTYRVTLVNTGSSNLTNVSIVDPLLSPDAENCAIVNVGGSCVLEGVYVVRPSDITAGMIENQAIATSDQVGMDTTKNQISVPEPSVSIVKNPPVLSTDLDNSGDISAGDMITYTIVATNNGSANLSNVVESDTQLTPSSNACPLLTPGEACTLVGTYTVTASDITAGQIDNKAFVQTSQTPIDSAEVTQTLSDPSFTIVKSITSNSDTDQSMDVSPGDTLTYTVTLTNSGTSNLTTVTVNDPLLMPDQMSCSLLLPGQTCVLSGIYVIQQTDLGTTVSNTATGDTDQTDSQIAQLDVNVPSAALAIQKSAPSISMDNDNSQDISPGDELTYIITATNTGDANLPDVTITDLLLSPSVENCGLLMSGMSCTLTGTYVVQESDLARGTITNRAMATAATNQPIDVRDTVITPLNTPSLTITKFEPELTDDRDGSGDISEDDQLTYRIKASNNGTANLSNVEVSDNLLTPSSITCPIVAPGDSCVLVGTYDVTRSDVILGQINNRAFATSNQTDPLSDARVTPLPNPLLSIDKNLVSNADGDASQDISVGDVLTYKVKSINTGSAGLTNMVVTDQKLTPMTETCPIVIPMDSCVLTGTYVVSVGDLAGGRIDNQATTTTDQLEPVRDNVTLVVPEPSLTIEKSFVANADGDASGDISVGDILSYEIIVMNDGSANLSNVVVTDDLISPSSITCPLVIPGETCVLTGTYTVLTSDVAASGISNVARVETNQLPIDSAEVMLPVSQPSLVLFKSQPVLTTDTDSSMDISAGDIISYEIAAINNGSANLTDIIISDPLLTPDALTCPLVAPGDTCLLQGNYLVTQMDVDNARINNKATASSTQTPMISDSVTQPLNQPSFDITKSLPVNSDGDGSMDISVGDTLTYTVTLTNTGTANLTDVVVSDPSLNADPVQCPLLLPGETCVLTGIIEVMTPQLMSQIDNVATGTSDQVGPMDADVSVNVPAPSMNVEKSLPMLVNDADGNGEISAGDELSYTITLTNNGDANLTNATIRDSLLIPSELNCGLLMPGEFCSLTGAYTVSQADIDNGSFTNVADGHSDLVPPVVDADTTTITLAQPEIAIVKSSPVLTGDNDNSTDISAGDEITYTITLTNTGTARLTEVEVSDPLLSPDSEFCPLVRPGETCVLTGIYSVSAADIVAGQIQNTAFGNSAQSEPDTAMLITPLRAPDASITKSFISNRDDDQSGDLSEGDQLTYEIVVTNIGTATLTDVFINDQMLTPSDVRCPIVAPSERCVLRGTYIVSSDDVAAGQITNVAASISDQTPEIRDNETVSLPRPLLGITKELTSLDDVDGSSDISVGDTLQYSVTAINSGSAALTDVRVSDPLLSPSLQICPILRPGESCILQGGYPVSAADVVNGMVPNEANAVSTQTEMVMTDLNVPVPSPSLRISKSAALLFQDTDGSQDVSQGDILQYTITATNNGTSNLTNVTISDNSIAISPNQSVCSIIRPGESCQLVGIYTVTSGDVSAGRIANTATAISDQTSTQMDDSDLMFGMPSIQLIKESPILLDDKDLSADFSAGDILQYQITAVNNGSSNLTNVTVSDPLLTPDQRVCPLLLPGQSCVLIGTYEIEDSDVNTTLTNRASVTTDQNVSDSDEVDAAIPNPSLFVLKSQGMLTDDQDNNGIPTAGDVLT
ncbi:MAG: hypothetical protein AAFR14_03470, partial [Bacteroidota bacterium]